MCPELEDDMEYQTFTAKTVEDAITEACKTFIVTSDKLDYQVVEEGSSGFLGFNTKPAVIKAREMDEEEILAAAAKKEREKKAIEAAKLAASLKEESSKEKPKKVEAKPVAQPQTIVSAEPKKSKSGHAVDAKVCEQQAKVFLEEVLAAMKMTAAVTTEFDEQEQELYVDLSGEDMGVLIGKRGATLDSLQYLVSLVVNKGTGDYIRVKVDTENYRKRRRETLENLARNIAYKVKRTKRPVSLEPMNPYERRIIHSALQNDKYVMTHSEGEEPFRRVVVTIKK